MLRGVSEPCIGEGLNQMNVSAQIVKHAPIADGRREKTLNDRVMLFLGCHAGKPSRRP